MARIRTIKPEFWSSGQVVECSTTSRLLFIGLWNFCDDAGRHPACYRRLKMEVFPADSITMDEIKKLVSELLNAGLVFEYKLQGQSYWQVTGWKHQKIQKPNIRYPAPKSRTSRVPVQDQSHTSTGPVTPGREGNGILDVSKDTSLPTTPPEFDAFWQAYPRRNGKRVGRAATLKRWKAIKSGERDALLLAAGHYAASKAARDGFAKDPERFLKNDFWRDWVDSESAASRVATREEIEAHYTGG